MGAAKELADKKVLRNLVPLKNLSPVHFKEVTKNAVIEEVPAGNFLFNQGKRDTYTFYVLSGEVVYLNGRQAVGSVTGGTDKARQPLANEQPRKLSAKANTKLTVMRIDSSLLDVLLDWDQSSQYEVTEISAQEDEDWMTKMLKSDMFAHIPPQNIQKMIMRMEEVRYKAGEMVIRQNDEGDCYFIIKNGHCIVSKQTANDTKPVLIAEMRDGDSFGEESLLSDGRRNASVTMITDGALMRLSKQDFQELLQDVLITKVNWNEACALVDDNAVWLDVQQPHDSQHLTIPGCINIPLQALRASKDRLNINDVYIVFCIDGHHSASAVFLLGQYGYDAVLLDGGLQNVPQVELKKVLVKPQHRGADVIPLKTQPSEVPRVINERQAGQVSAHNTPADRGAPPSTKPRVRDSRALEDLLLENKTSQAQVHRLREELDKARNALAQQDQEISAIVQEKEKLAQRVKDIAVKAKETRAEIRDVDVLHKQFEDMQYEHELERKDLNKVIEGLKKNLEKAETAKNDIRSLRSELEQNVRLREQVDTECEVLRAELSEGAGRSAAIEKLETLIANSQQKLKEAQEHNQVLDKRLTEFKALQANEASSVDNELSLVSEELKRSAEENQDLQKRLMLLLTEKEAIERQRSDADMVRASLVEQQQYSKESNQKEIEDLRDEVKGLRQDISNKQTLVEQLTRDAKKNSDVDTERREYLTSLEQHQARITSLEKKNGELEGVVKKADESLTQALEQKAKLEFDWQTSEKTRTGLTEQHKGTLKASEEKSLKLESQLNAERKANKDTQDKLKASLEDRDRKYEKLAGDAKTSRLERDKFEKELKEIKKHSEKSVGSLESENVKLKKTLENHEIKIREIESLMRALDDEKSIIEETKMDLQQSKQTSEQEWTSKYDKLLGDHRALKYRYEQIETNADGEKTELQHSKKRIAELEKERTKLFEQIKTTEQKAIDKAGIDGELKSVMRKMKELERQHQKLQGDSKAQVSSLESTIATLQTNVDRYKNLQSMLEEKNHCLEDEVSGLSNKAQHAGEFEKEVTKLKRQLAQVQQTNKSRNDSSSSSNFNIKEHTDYIELQQEYLSLKDELDEAQSQMRDKDKEVHAMKVRLDAGPIEKDNYKPIGIQKPKADPKTDKDVRNLKSELENAKSAQAETEKQLKAAQLILRETDNKYKQISAELVDTQKAGSQTASLREKLEEVKRSTKDQLKHYQYEYEAMAQTAQEENRKLQAEIAQLRHQLNSKGSSAASQAQPTPQRFDNSRVMRLDLPPETNDNIPMVVDEVPSTMKRAQNTQRFSVPLSTPMSNPRSNYASQSQHNSNYNSHHDDDDDFVPRKRFSFGRFMAMLVAFGLLGAGAYWYFEIYPKTQGEIARQTGSTDTRVGEQVPEDKTKGIRVIEEQPVKRGRDAENTPVSDGGEQAENTIKVKPGELFKDKLKVGSVGPEMTEIPKAKYLMGNKNNALDASETPAHPVTLKSFAISRYEVTFDQYVRFVQATNHRSPDDKDWGKGNRPVINVSWQDAVAYTRWLSDQTGQVYRLPSEAEWEYAARAGTTTDYYWGADQGKNNANCFDCGSEWDAQKTAPAGKFKANAFGLHDMLGNVMEWTMDCYHPNYEGAPKDGNPRLTGTCKTKVLRGGSYLSTDDRMRNFARDNAAPETATSQIGFRVVREM